MHIAFHTEASCREQKSSPNKNAEVAKLKDKHGHFSDIK